MFFDNIKDSIFIYKKKTFNILDYHKNIASMFFITDTDKLTLGKL